ncbi:hypothetical protein HK101_005110 [Irineochytrium annulatum]|nr:hypothetical protein HK101_005110 [Irineochytrium annulatum]
MWVDHVRITADKDTIYILGSAADGGSSELTVTEVYKEDGKPKRVRNPSNGSVRSAKEDTFFVYSGNDAYLVWNGADRNAYSLKLGAEDVVHLNPQVVRSIRFSEKDCDGDKVILKANGENAVVVPASRELGISHFILRSGAAEAALSFLKDGSIHTAFKFTALKEGETSAFSVSRDRGSAVLARVRQSLKANALVELVDLKSDKSILSTSVPYNYEANGPITQAFLDVIVKKDGPPGFRVLVVTESGTVELAGESQVKWTRNESLTETAATAFVDLPEADLLSLEHDELNEPVKETDSLSPWERYLKRWNTHLTHLQAFVAFPNIASKILELQESLLSPSIPSLNVSAPVVMKRDLYGFRKLLIFVSKTGKLMGFETERGALIWTKYIPKVHVRELFAIRDTVVKYPPVLAVVADDGKDTIVGYVNALNGDWLNSQHPWERVNGIAAQIFPLPVQEDVEHYHPLAVIDSERNIHIVPNTASARAAFETMLPNFYFYLTSGLGSNKVDGFMAVKKPRSATYGSKLVWTVVFPEGEKIAALAARSRDGGAKVASLGRVLGNRSVLYKYLNPNLLAVATVRATDSTSNLYLYLVDTVTGAIYHRSAYPGAGHVSDDLPSVALIQTEHMVVASFFNRGADSAELISEPDGDVMEDEEGRKRKGKKKLAKKAALSAPDVKGYEVVVLEVFEIGLGNEQLYGMNKRLLDTRRPMGAPTGDDKEEMLIPYSPVLGYNPRDVVSYYLKVANIENVVSSPSDIESTSLVAAYGLDVFFSRRSPSKTFDVLSEDFNYFSLIMTMIALVGAIQIARFFAQRKRLNDQWK